MTGGLDFKESWCELISVSVSQACVNRSSTRRDWKRWSIRMDISGRREAELNPTTATLHCLCGGNGSC